MKGKRLIVIGATVLALCFGLKSIRLLWSGLCALVSWIWALICGVAEWCWTVTLKILSWILAPAWLIAEEVFDGGCLAWCMGLAVEAILIGVIIAIVTSVAKNRKTEIDLLHGKKQREEQLDEHGNQ